MVGEVRHPAGDPVLPAIRGRPLRPAPRHHLLDEGDVGRPGTSAATRWRVAHRSGARTSAADSSSWPAAASRSRSHPRSTGHDRFQRRGVLHEQLAPRGRRLHRQAGRRDRHRLVGHPVHPADRGARRPSSRSSSAPRTSPFRPTTVRRRSGSRPLEADRAAYRDAARWSRAGVPREITADRRRLRDRRRAAGALRGGVGGRRADRDPRCVQRPLGERDLQRDRRRDDPREDPRDRGRIPIPPRHSVPRITRSGPSDPASIPTTSRPTTCPTSGWSTSAGTRSSSITEAGIDTAAESFEFDAIVYATGFDAMTGPVVAVDITGRDGVALREKWADGPSTYLGLTTVGFPNFFTITGPGSPSVLSNMAVSIEQHVDWVVGPPRRPRERAASRPSSRPRWRRRGGTSTWTTGASITLYPTANSWYMGANVPGKPRAFLPYIGGVDAYRAACDEVVARDYLGFMPRRARRGSSANDGVIRRLQPDVALVLKTMAELDLPPMESLRVEEARALHAGDGGGAAARAGGGRGRRRRAPGGLERTLAYRLYRPASAGSPPVVAYFHGGGWVLGSLDSDDPFCRDLCAQRRRRRRVGELPARARGPLPGRGRRRLRRRAMDRRPCRRARAAFPVRWRWRDGAPAPTSPPSPASWPATPAGPTSSGSCCSHP